MEFSIKKPILTTLKEFAQDAEPWNEEKKRELQAIANRMFQCDWSHGRAIVERENCGACTLNGYQPSRREDRDPDYDVRKHGPNYSGWLRLYVQTGRISGLKKFKRGVLHDLVTNDNQSYLNALRRDIVTFIR